MTSRRRGQHVRRRTPPGAPPGTLIADPAAVGSSISLIGYSDAEVIEHHDISTEEIQRIRGTLPIMWINVDGLANIELIRQLGEIFNLHGLALEDVVNVHQRPKAEEYEGHVFIVTRMVVPGRRLETEQVSMFVGKDFILTFQERPGDCFDPVRERLRRHRGRIRQAGTDYLCYVLIDAVTDGYFPVLEECGERLENLEDAVVTNPEPELVAEVHAMKRELLGLRRAVWPHREMINVLIRDENPLMTDQTRVYLRDSYDHAIQLMDIVETYREIALGLVDVYLSSMSTRLNDIMKVLTVIATIFIPLGFIASLYGMNFDPSVSPWNMPELGWRYGYPFALLAMLACAAVLLLYFLRERWISLPWTRSPPVRKAPGDPSSGRDGG